MKTPEFNETQTEQMKPDTPASGGETNHMTMKLHSFIFKTNISVQMTGIVWTVFFFAYSKGKGKGKGKWCVAKYGDPYSEFVLCI